MYFCISNYCLSSTVKFLTETNYIHTVPLADAVSSQTSLVAVHHYEIFQPYIICRHNRRVC